MKFNILQGNVFFSSGGWHCQLFGGGWWFRTDLGWNVSFEPPPIWKMYFYFLFMKKSEHRKYARFSNDFASSNNPNFDTKKNKINIHFSNQGLNVSISAGGWWFWVWAHHADSVSPHLKKKRFPKVFFVQVLIFWERFQIFFWERVVRFVICLCVVWTNKNAVMLRIGRFHAN